MTHDPRNEAQQLLEEAMATDARGDADRAAELLRRSIALQPVNPFAHYLLGADCAERGVNGDAVLHLTTAVEQAPRLWEARLQLALLWLTQDNLRTAASVAGPLQELPDTTAMHHFGAALSLAANGQAGLACAALRQGLAIGCDNAPLMADMRTLLQRLEQSQPGRDQEADLQTMQIGLAINAYSGGGQTDR